MSLTYAYYPGCSGQGTSMEYESSTRACFQALGIGLVEIEDWSCCGSTPAHTVDHVLSSALSARNLELARQAGHNLVTTPCPSCLTNLKVAEKHAQDEEFLQKMNKLLDEPYEGGVETQSTLQVLFEALGVDEIKKRIVKPLKGLKIAPYYGCIMNRPPDVMKFDDHENPIAMDEILKAMGAEVAPFPLKVECCGASFGVAKNEVVMRLSGKLLDAAVGCGAEAIAVACPLCQMNLDLRQNQINKALGTDFNIPVLYITQLLGLALGLPEKELGLDKLNINPKPLLEKAFSAAAE